MRPLKVLKNNWINSKHEKLQNIDPRRRINIEIMNLMIKRIEDESGRDERILMKDTHS